MRKLPSEYLLIAYRDIVSRITDEHQNPSELADEQTPIETETLDDDYDDEKIDENKQIKKSVLPIKMIGIAS